MKENETNFKKYYCKSRDIVFKPGMVVIFDGCFIGMLTGFYNEDGVWAKIMEPSGHCRKRRIDHDSEQGILRPYPLGEAAYIHTQAWDEWKRLCQSGS